MHESLALKLAQWTAKSGPRKTPKLDKVAEALKPVRRCEVTYLDWGSRKRELQCAWEQDPENRHLWRYQRPDGTWSDKRWRRKAVTENICHHLDFNKRATWSEVQPYRS